MNLRVSINKDVYLLKCNFYGPRPILSGPNFQHLTSQKGGFSYPYPMDSGKKSHKIVLWAAERSFQWFMLHILFLPDKPR
jgi:hypothetical protein